MSPLFRIFVLLWREERAALSRGLLLSVAVLLAGAALLGLSGWFIVAAGAAGVAGIGIAFDVFRPSAGVRLLALGRTAARYGERLLTHDATLRALARLRVRLLDRLSNRDAEALARLRSSETLNRMTADVDALDGIAIRLAFPIAAGSLTLALSFGLLAWLVTPLVASVVVAPLACGALAVFLLTGRAAIVPAAQAEAERQDLRSRAIEHLRGRTTLAFAGALPASQRATAECERRSRRAERRLARLDRRAEILVSAAGLAAAGGALAVGGLLALWEVIPPAGAAIGVFASLALTETLAPLQRGVAEIGRMRAAADRILPLLQATNPPEATSASATNPATNVPLLSLDEVVVAASGSATPLTAPVTLDIRPGEAVALTGRSGRGKSTLLHAIAGLRKPISGQILFAGASSDTMTEADLRARLGLLPQRSALVSGTVRDNLRLGAPDASEAAMTKLLDLLGLTPVLDPVDGFDTRLGEAGAGFSGGETRRLALARTLLRHPDILLLDEPTEGLDPTAARQVLSAIRAMCPSAAILIATHKPSDIAACDRQFAI